MFLAKCCGFGKLQRPDPCFRLVLEQILLKPVFVINGSSDLTNSEQESWDVRAFLQPSYLQLYELRIGSFSESAPFTNCLDE